MIPKSKLSPNGTLYSSTPTNGLAATYEQIDDDTTYNKLKGISWVFFRWTNKTDINFSRLSELRNFIILKLRFELLAGEHPYAQVIENDSATSSTYG